MSTVRCTAPTVERRQGKKQQVFNSKFSCHIASKADWTPNNWFRIDAFVPDTTPPPPAFSSSRLPIISIYTAPWSPNTTTAICLIGFNSASTSSPQTCSHSDSTFCFKSSGTYWSTTGEQISHRNAFPRTRHADSWCCYLMLGTTWFKTNEFIIATSRVGLYK